MVSDYTMSQCSVILPKKLLQTKLWTLANRKSKYDTQQLCTAPSRCVCRSLHVKIYLEYENLNEV
jgi:hypothetical protein